MPTNGWILEEYEKRSKTIKDIHFEMAHSIARLATCPRKQVGCVIVDSYGMILTSGYNGAPESLMSCMEMEDGCILEGGHCVSSVHAEIRAIANAARRGVSLNGSTAFVTLLPCINCFQSMLLAGVGRVEYDEAYERDEKVKLFERADYAGISLVGRNEE